jgi:hypothetical protein
MVAQGSIANLSVSLILWLMRGWCTVSQFMMELVGFGKMDMAVDIVEKDNVAITWLYEVSLGV